MNAKNLAKGNMELSEIYKSGLHEKATDGTFSNHFLRQHNNNNWH